MKLLIVEDSARLSAALTSDFRREGFAVDHAGDGQAALGRSKRTSTIW